MKFKKGLTLDDVDAIIIDDKKIECHGEKIGTIVGVGNKTYNKESATNRLEELVKAYKEKSYKVMSFENF